MKGDRRVRDSLQPEGTTKNREKVIDRNGNNMKV